MCIGRSFWNTTESWNIVEIRHLRRNVAWSSPGKFFLSTVSLLSAKTLIKDNRDERKIPPYIIYTYMKFLKKASNRESDHCFIPKLVTVVKIEIMITVTLH